MRRKIVLSMGIIGISLGIFGANQEIDFGVFAESSMTNFTNLMGNTFTNNANPIGEYLGYKYTLDKKSYIQAEMNYSGYQSNVNYVNINNINTNGQAGNNRLQLSAVYGYDIHQELLMPVPTYVEVGLGYGNWGFNSPSNISGYPSQMNINWFSIPVGLAIVNHVGETTYTLRGGALAEIGGQANYNSFGISSGGTITTLPSESLNISTTIGYYLNLETAYQLNANWLFKWKIYYANTPLKTTGSITGLEGYTLGNINNQNAGVMCALGYQF